MTVNRIHALKIIMANFLMEMFARNMGNTAWLVKERRQGYNQWLTEHLTDLERTLGRLGFDVYSEGQWLEATVEFGPDFKGYKAVWLRANDNTYIVFTHSGPLSLLNWKPWDGWLDALWVANGCHMYLATSRGGSVYTLFDRLKEVGAIRYGENNVYTKAAKEAYAEYVRTKQGDLNA